MCVIETCQKTDWYYLIQVRGAAAEAQKVLRLPIRVIEQWLGKESEWIEKILWINLVQMISCNMPSRSGNSGALPYLMLLQP